jgi:hypothetical protein
MSKKSPVVSFHEEFDRIYKKYPYRQTFQIIEFGRFWSTLSVTT